ncbi:VWA domain-containing protein [Aeromonas molluscorum]|jgi:Ca-activated chloride channel homolog|uniref:von Willebrand factor type A domain-containing protein n=1 Tax=Aeromonas molluscorum 848 TaxID=1268236 RepID=R1GPA1_9GAMM|nr:VWA domain-containing protein [Aeromonas molluscorum]EOD53490.1 von Willebrand factor type A domain-containing protein [Aeromonas molluscorum 848]
MILAWPWFALALVLPLLVRSLPPLHRPRLHHDGFALQGSQGGLPLWYGALLWGALVLALCRPQLIGEPIVQYQDSRDLLLAVDLSDSMRTPDMFDGSQQQDRLSAVRKQIKQLILARQGDRIALIVFADHAYLLSPLTEETQALLTLADELDFDLVGRTTALGEAIALANTHKEADREAALLLITDGRNTAGTADPLVQARQAVAAGLKIYTLGVGADPDSQALTPAQPDPSTELDEPLLTELATLGQGHYFRARTQGDLLAMNQRFDQLEPGARAGHSYRPLTELYPWPLFLFTLLLLPGLRRPG